MSADGSTHSAWYISMTDQIDAAANDMAMAKKLTSRLQILYTAQLALLAATIGSFLFAFGLLVFRPESSHWLSLIVPAVYLAGLLAVRRVTDRIGARHDMLIGRVRATTAAVNAFLDNR